MKHEDDRGRLCPACGVYHFATPANSTSKTKKICELLRRLDIAYELLRPPTAATISSLR